MDNRKIMDNRDTDTISRPTEQQIHCNKCKHYQGVHGVQGHAPCSYWKSGGVLWNWYCSQAEPYQGN